MLSKVKQIESDRVESSRIGPLGRAALNTRNGDGDDTTRNKQAKWNVFRSTEKQINETKETNYERNPPKVTKENEGIKIKSEYAWISYQYVRVDYPRPTAPAQRNMQPASRAVTNETKATPI